MSQLKKKLQNSFRKLFIDLNFDKILKNDPRTDCTFDNWTIFSC